MLVLHMSNSQTQSQLISLPFIISHDKTCQICNTHILKEHTFLYILIFNLTLVRTSTYLYDIAFQSRLCEGVDVLQIEVRAEHLVIHILNLSPSPLLLLFPIFWRILIERARTEGLTETERKLRKSCRLFKKTEPWEDNGGGGVVEAGIWGWVDWPAGEEGKVVHTIAWY